MSHFPDWKKNAASERTSDTNSSKTYLAKQIAWYMKMFCWSWNCNCNISVHFQTGWNLACLQPKWQYAFCGYFANMTLPYHSVNKLLAPTIPRSQQGNQAAKSIFYLYHSCFVFLVMFLMFITKQHVFLRTVIGEMCFAQTGMSGVYTTKSWAPTAATAAQK